MHSNDLIYKYWGKAGPDGSYHLLPYHCLDVAAVASVWWNLSPSIQRSFCYSSNLSNEQTKAWVLFYVALHDIGKFDIRFQRKVVQIWHKVKCSDSPSRLSIADSQRYFHGPAGLYWLSYEFEETVLGKKKKDILADTEKSFDFGWDEDIEERPLWKTWKTWLEAVTGHHGHIVSVENNSSAPLPMDCPKEYACSPHAWG
mgnify:CR=1 FL=1